MLNRERSPFFEFELFSPVMGGLEGAPAFDLNLRNIANSKIQDRAVSFEYVEDVDKAAKVTIVFDNNDLSLLDNSIFRLGNLVRFDFGYPGKTFGFRNHIMYSMKGSERLKLESIDVTKATMGVANREVARLFENHTRAQAARRIAGDYGFKKLFIQEIETDILELRDRIKAGFEFFPDIQLDALRELELLNRQIRTRGIRKDFVQSKDKNDWTFLKDLASEIGFVFFIRGDEFHFHDKRTNQPPKILRYFNPDVNQSIQGDIKSFSIDFDTLGKPASYKVFGYDIFSKQNVEGFADRDSTGRHVDGSSTVLPYIVIDRIIQPVLQFFEVVGKDADVPISNPKGLIPRKAIPTAENSSRAALAQAQAEFKEAESRALVAKVTTVGDPSLQAGQSVSIFGIGKVFSGLWRISKVKHTISPSKGYETILGLDKNAVDDPESPSVGRNAKLPQFVDEEKLERILKDLKRHQAFLDPGLRSEDIGGR